MAPKPARRHHVNDVADVVPIPRPRRPAVLLFAYPSFAYGHVARCHKIARALVRTTPVEAYVVSSYPDYSTGADEEAVHEVFLPAFGLDAADAPPEGLVIANPVSPLPGVPVSELSAHRAALLSALVSHLAPRGLHCEGFPFVRPAKAIAECGPALALLAAKSPATLRSAGFNGVLTALYAQDEQQAQLIGRALWDEIDILFVYVGETERADVVRQCPPLAAVEHKLRFVGYVGGAPPGPASGEPRILAMFGGGIDAYRKVVLVCEAFVVFHQRRPGWTLDLVTGGVLPEPTFEEIARRYASAEGIRVSRFAPGLARRLNDYQLVISMAGYNACTELYQASTRSIVLPRILPGFLEQLDQARKFQAFGAIDHIVDADRTSPPALADQMERALAAAPSPRRALDLGGADAAARTIARELERRASGS